MNYADAIAELFSLESRGIRMGVRRMRAALDHRGNPERGLRFVHVAGTNGKGSVATMIATCLRASGYRTGLFTSPHLHRYVERVRIDGRPLSEHEAARRITELLNVFGTASAPETTFFELTNVLAIEAFRDHGCDVGVLEVGLGGRLDSTNAVGSEATVITRIAVDHTKFLGHTIASIAREKAGILKHGAPLVLGARDREARRVILARARRLGCAVQCIDRDFEPLDRARGEFAVRVGDHSYDGLRLRLAGAHQRDNAACAVAALHALRDSGFESDDVSVREGLRLSRWPGRLETVSGRPRVLFDCAHNLDGCVALVRHLDALPPGRRTLVFGAMRDKQLAPMLKVLAPRFRRVFYCPPSIPRAATLSELQRAHRGTATGGLTDALTRARRSAGPDGLVVIAGSIFLVAEARERVLGTRSDPFIRM